MDDKFENGSFRRKVKMVLKDDSLASNFKVNIIPCLIDALSSLSVKPIELIPRPIIREKLFFMGSLRKSIILSLKSIVFQV